MRIIKYTNQFKRDYKREKRSCYSKTLDDNLMKVVNFLTLNQDLPKSMRDHALSGEWNDCRDCHIRPDLILIYRKPDPHSLELVRIGSHSELGI